MTVLNDPIRGHVARITTFRIDGPETLVIDVALYHPETGRWTGMAYTGVLHLEELITTLILRGELTLETEGWADTTCPRCNGNRVVYAPHEITGEYGMRACPICQGTGDIVEKQLEDFLPRDPDDEIIPELVETLGQVIRHWHNAGDPWQHADVDTTPRETYNRAHALYHQYKHILEEDFDV